MTEFEPERAVLGAVFLSPQVMSRIEWLRPEEFFSNKNRLIFEVMRELHGEGTDIDAVTVGNRLLDKGQLKEAGGATYMGDLTENCPTSANVDHYARLVKEQWASRHIAVEAAKLMDVAGGRVTGKTTGSRQFSIEDIGEKLERLRSLYEEMLPGKEPVSIFDLGDKVLEGYEKVANGATGIEFPWPSLTNTTMGMWPGTITFFIARPGTGKTQIATLCGAHAWRASGSVPGGRRVLIISPEMSKDEIAERFFVGEAKVSYPNVVKGMLSSFEYPKFKGAVDALRNESGIWIMDSEDGLSPQNIDSKIKLLKPHLVAVDAVYELPFKGDDMEKVAAALTWMRSSSKRHNYACVAFSQFNRKQEEIVKKGGGSRLGVIAMSDKIGWVAHSVFALEQDKDMKLDRRLKIVPLKLRRGQHLGDGIEIRWDFNAMDFSEIAAGAGGAPGFVDADDVVPF